MREAYSKKVDLSTGNVIHIDQSDWPEKRKQWTLSAFVPYGEHAARMQTVKDYIAAHLKYSFVFWGNSRTGKSHLANAVVKERIKAAPLSFVIDSFRSINAMVREDFSKENVVLGSLARPRILVIEEVGDKSYDSQFEYKNLLAIIDARLERNLQTIITTNLDKEKFLILIGEYAANRLEESALFVHFDWPRFKSLPGECL